MRPIIKHKRPAGFTLIELAAVVLIIGLLMAFVLAAAASGIESARTRATQALIAKLSAGLEDRLQALLASTPDVNGAHKFVAAINPPGVAPINRPWGLTSDQRAQVIARFDQIRREFPDVFYIDPVVANGGTKGLYPVRFGGLPYPDPSDSSAPIANYVLPLGNSIAPGFLEDTSYTPGAGGFANTGPGAAIGGAGSGINGASYAAAAALYKLMGYTPKGCDGVDNNNDGFIDEYLEGISDPNDNTGANSEAVAKVDNFLLNHTHKTARAEMLYALLVEGVGPLGSVFSKEDFKDTEVKDTDNDGVPEFVDGWGEPLQFFRWPYAHRSEAQKGDALYGTFEARQLNPLDQNSQLTALQWWCNNAAANQMSLKCLVFQNLFGPLYDPNWVSGVSPQPSAWDRSGISGRRAFATKFLILSGGPDREPGVPRLTDYDVRNTGRFSSFSLAQAITGTITQSGAAATIMPGESWAMKLDPNNLPPWAQSQYATVIDNDVSLDDITNQNLQTKVGFQ